MNESICRCLQEIGVLLDDGDRRAMQEVGLTPTQFNLLRRLEGDTRAVGYTVTRLAALTLCTRGNVSRIVQRLAEAGMVEIRSDHSDQRRVRVHLTPLGADRLAAAQGRHAKLNSARFAGLTDEAAAELLEKSTGIADMLRDHLARRGPLDLPK